MTLDDTQPSWTDAELEDSIHHAVLRGRNEAQTMIATEIALRIAALAETMHNTRVDDKRYAQLEKAYAALTTAHAIAQQPMTTANLETCNCEDE